MKNKTIKIVTDYIDGWFSYRLATDEDRYFVEVSKDLYDLWVGHTQMEDVIQEQLKKIDNDIYERQVPECGSCIHWKECDDSMLTTMADGQCQLSGEPMDSDSNVCEDFIGS